MVDTSDQEAPVSQKRKQQTVTGPRPRGIGKYGQEIIKYAQMHYKPGQIADLLQQEHSISPGVANRKSVESRLCYLKKNSLAPLPPTNDISTLGAELSKRARSCNYDFLIILIIGLISIFLGTAAQVLGKELTDKPIDVMDNDKESADEPSSSIHETLAIAFQNAGLFWQKELPSCWVLIFSCSLSTSIMMEKPEHDGIHLTFTSSHQVTLILLTYYNKNHCLTHT